MNLGNNGVLSDQLASPRHTLISRLGFLFALSLLLLTALLLHTSFHSLAVTSVLSGFYGIGEDDVTVTAAGHRAAPPNTAPNQAFGGGQDRVILNLSSVRKRNHLEDFVRNESLSSVDNGSSLHGTTEEANDGVSDPKVLLLQKGEEKANDQRISFGEKEITNQSEGDCDLFSGKWVRHYSRPYYPPGSCPFVDRHFDCQRNGRPDHAYYLNWKWKPTACPLPRLNATDFLVRLRGKRLVFVGDSLNRNMWESMVCILHRRIRNKKRVYEISGRSDFKKKGFYAFRFEDYNCSVDFVAAPFLVRPSSYNRANGSIETLRLDLMDHTTTMYHDAEILVFNTGHWWTHEKTSRGEDYYQEGNHVYPRLKALEAYRKALTTWARWIDKNVDSSKTQVFFRGYSVTHFWGGQWNSGGQCHKETEPIANETHLTHYPSKMRALEHVLRWMKIPVTYLNVSRLTNYRKDAHPSIYRKQYRTAEERDGAEGSQDCSHWCLPGVPDTWNELLYASLLNSGKGDWRN